MTKTINRKTKHERVKEAPGLYRRYYQHEDGRQTAQSWVWRSSWAGRVRELPLGPVFLIPRAAAVELAKSSTARKRAKWSYEQILHEVRELLIDLRDERLAEQMQEAVRMNPLTGAVYAAKAKEHAETMGEYIERALAPKGGA